MNKCCFVGRIANDLEISQSGDTQYLRFRIAVRRPRNGKDGQPQTDFVPCVAFNKTAEFIHKYFKKGDYIYVTASYRTDEYQAKDGSKRYSHDFFVDDAGFCSSASKSDGAANGNSEPAPSTQSNPAPSTHDDPLELPF